MENNPIDDESELAAKIGARVVELGLFNAIVGIDGADGAGKTTLARNLSPSIAAPVFSLDDFIAAKRDAYVDFLDCEKARDQIKARTSMVLVDGVCLLAAAHKCGFEIAVLVYVKLMSADGRVWRHRDDMGTDEDPETVIRRRTQLLRDFAKLEAFMEWSGSAESEPLGLPGLEKELIRYHAAYRPHERADFIFHRRETAVE